MFSVSGAEAAFFDFQWNFFTTKIWKGGVLARELRYISVLVGWNPAELVLTNVMYVHEVRAQIFYPPFASNLGKSLKHGPKSIRNFFFN